MTGARGGWEGGFTMLGVGTALFLSPDFRASYYKLGIPNPKMLQNLKLSEH